MPEPATTTLNSGAGDDNLDGGGGADDLTGGAGTDSTTYSTRTANVTITPDGASNDGSSEDDNGSRRDNVAADIENITGGHADDTILGTSVRNMLKGAQGNDSLSGFDGDDVLDGGVLARTPARATTGSSAARATTP